MYTYEVSHYYSRAAQASIYMYTVSQCVNKSVYKQELTASRVQRNDIVGRHRLQTGGDARDKAFTIQCSAAKSRI